jgi:hypothetical protein
MTATSNEIIKIFIVYNINRVKTCAAGYTKIRHMWIKRIFVARKKRYV